MSRDERILNIGIALGCVNHYLNERIETNEEAVSWYLAVMVYLWGKFDELRSRLNYYLEIGSLGGTKEYYKWRRVS